MTLRVDALSVALGRRQVLREASFEARRGEFLMVVGPNGAGKTTALRAIAGLIPFSGGIAWDGENLAAMGAARRARCLAYLPQGHVAHWPVSVRDAVAIGRAPCSSSLARLSTADNAAIDAALAAVEVTQFADRPITELSGGERARAMLARALAVGAPLLLADEPAASLDPEHQLAVMGVLAAKAKAGGTVIAVSHDLLLAARFADRVLVLNAGAVAACDTPAEALSPSRLREVFKVEARTFADGAAEIAVPWTVVRP